MSFADRSQIFFDLDGTLTHPAPGITRSIAYALECVGAESPPLEALERYIGPPLHHAFAELLETDEAARIDEAVKAYRERYARVGLYECTLMPGVEALLRALGSSERSLWIVTAKPTPFAIEVARHFGIVSHFAAVHGPDLSGRRSDKVELIAHVLCEEDIPARDAVMIGDRSHDMRGASSNGVAAIGVLWGYGSERELRDAGATCVVDSTAALQEVLESRT